MRNANDAGSFRNWNRSRKIKSQLPVEIPLSFENGLADSRTDKSTGLRNPCHADACAAADTRVGVGHRRHLGNDFGIAVSRGNRQITGSGPVVREIPQPRWRFRENETELGAIGRGFAGRRVVHAENDVRSLGHKLRRIEAGEILRAKSRIELAQEIGTLPWRPTSVSPAS